MLFNTRGEVVAKASVPLGSYYPQVGFVEQDPEEIYQNTLASLRRCMESATRSYTSVRERVATVGISNQRETFLL